MKKDFWLERWNKEKLGFHEIQANAYLTRYWHELELVSGARVFVPLCGKSVDMIWLQEEGHEVLGVELSEVAVRAFYAEQGMVPSCSSGGKFSCYSANNIKLLCGDFFDVNRLEVGEISAVYDRASMVALPPEQRESYVKHMLNILPDQVQILLVTFTYPQAEMQGPPFSVTSEEVLRVYAQDMNIRLLAEFDVLAENPRFRTRGLSRLYESVYLLQRKKTWLR
jgi:thiopurine S-methyltransferase